MTKYITTAKATAATMAHMAIGTLVPGLLPNRRRRGMAVNCSKSVQIRKEKPDKRQPRRGDRRARWRTVGDMATRKLG
jgi:hypothetical protein